MKTTATLSRYLAKSYFLNFLFLLLALLSVIYMFDTVELIRRASKHDDVPLSLVLQMGLFKLPEVGQILLPFAILFSAMFTFWQLTRRYELIVVRAAGFSVWQFLTPVIGVAILVGFLQMGVLNPLGSLLLGKFEQLENTHLKRQTNQIALFKEGLWLRQALDEDGGYVILHASRVQQPQWILKNLSVFYFDDHDEFLKRVDAPEAQLDHGHWKFEKAVIYEPGQEVRHSEAFMLPTNLTTRDVEESFATPATLAFWRLPAHIKMLEETGFDASRLRVHYHNLLAQPLMFAAMVLLAGIVSMRPPRSRGGTVLFGSGIFIGFLVFFMSSFLQALGASHQIPVILAAWAPAVISFLMGLSIMMNIEDG